MRKIVSIRLEEELLAAARREARAQRRTLTNYIEGLVARDLARTAADEIPHLTEKPPAP